MGKAIGVYVRVSSTRQNLASQIPDLERWVLAYGGDSEIEWYTDKATGKNMDRPGWAKLEKDMKAGKIGTVVCWRIDRLGRNARQLTALFDDLSKAKINLVSTREGMDLSTPMGRMVSTIMASQAQYETEVRCERVQAGLEVAKANGVKLGRRPTPPGERAKRIKVTPEQEATIKRLAAEGEKKARIARATGVSRQTVYDVLNQGAPARGRELAAAVKETERQRLELAEAEALPVEPSPAPSGRRRSRPAPKATTPNA